MYFEYIPIHQLHLNPLEEECDKCKVANTFCAVCEFKTCTKCAINILRYDIMVCDCINASDHLVTLAHKTEFKLFAAQKIGNALIKGKHKATSSHKMPMP